MYAASYESINNKRSRVFNGLRRKCVFGYSARMLCHAEKLQMLPEKQNTNKSPLRGGIISRTDVVRCSYVVNSHLWSRYNCIVIVLTKP